MVVFEFLVAFNDFVLVLIIYNLTPTDKIQYRFYLVYILFI